jgi:NADPH:quinone reductase-like Zn-dependent oxidoreductase
MRAAVTKTPGGPVVVEEVPDPTPRAGEVLVRVHAASVNRLDRAVFEGKAMGGAATFPLVQGVDAAGVVVTGGGSVPAGLRVAVKPSIACNRCRWCRRGRQGDCERATTFGIHRQGGYAELLAVPRTNVAALPASLSFEEGAAAAHTHAVVLRMIRASGVDLAAATVLVTGASGALGTAAVQLASAMGAKVVAATSSATKWELVATLGAEMGVASGPGMADAVRKATDGIGPDLILETTGRQEIIDGAVEALARAGRIVFVGAVPGTGIEIDIQTLYRRRQAFVGSAGSHLVDFVDTYRLLDEHGVHPVIAHTYPLSETGRALEDILDRGRIGKLVIETGATP